MRPPRRPRLQPLLSRLVDEASFTAANLAQFRPGRSVTTPGALAAYFAGLTGLCPASYYALPRDAAGEGPVLPPPDAAPRRNAAGIPVAYPVVWRSPVRSGYPANDRARADFYPCAPAGGEGWAPAPTVFLLHGLMSASDFGYRLWAAAFNARGWNACFVHLPYHYSRRPAGFLNGELCVSADLIRVHETLRQAVVELRQLAAALRAAGGGGFGLWGTSYGGWIGALLSFVESGFCFWQLIQPVVDVPRALWRSPASWGLSWQLRRAGLTPADTRPGMRLISPLAHRPVGGAHRVTLAAARYDAITRRRDLRRLQRRWPGAAFFCRPQGHVGYHLMHESFRRLLRSGVLDPRFRSDRDPAVRPGAMLGA